MRSRQASIAGFVVALAPLAAMANDFSATLAAGGLVLTKSADIVMKSENLSLSERQVDVKYGFLNKSARDVTVVVAFPMPDLTPDPNDNEGAPVPVDSPANFLHFATTVDGKTVAAQLELKAVANGVDQTALLRRLRVPLWPFRDSTSKALNRLPAATQDQLVALGLIAEEMAQTQADPASGSKAKPAPRQFRPLWTLKTTYYWKQTFPAGRVLSVEHRYQPVVGSWVSNYWEFDPDPDMVDDERAQMQAQKVQYCVDDAFVSTAHALNKSGAWKSEVTSQFLQYVLVTGANWAGPIGDFTMTVEKAKTRDLVSFCGDGVRKIGPTTYQVHYVNFTPTKDVSVLYLEPH